MGHDIQTSVGGPALASDCLSLNWSCLGHSLLCLLSTKLVRLCGLRSRHVLSKARHTRTVGCFISQHSNVALPEPRAGP